MAPPSGLAPVLLVSKKEVGRVGLGGLRRLLGLGRGLYSSVIGQPSFGAAGIPATFFGRPRLPP
jgi:hypothetical protein